MRVQDAHVSCCQMHTFLFSDMQQRDKLTQLEQINNNTNKCVILIKQFQVEDCQLPMNEVK